MRAVTATEKYKAVNEGRMAKAEFVRQMRQLYPMYLSPMNTYNDTVDILKHKGLLFEAKEEKPLHLSDETIRRGIDAELEAMGIDSAGPVSQEDQDKAKAKALSNLNKNALHYLHLLSGDSNKVDKHDKYQEVKKNNHKDTFNDMKKAELKESVQVLEEGTRALVGYLSGDRLTATYNHYDGYPSNLGKGLEAHYNDDEKAKEVAMSGYITYLDPETGEIEATHKQPPKKINLPEEDEDLAREVAEQIDSMGADYGYIWDDRADHWVTIKNTGIRSMIDQIVKKMGTYSEVQEAPVKSLREQTIDLIAYLKQEKGADNEMIKDFIKTHFNDIKGMSLDQIGDEFDEFVSVNYELPGDYNDLAEAYSPGSGWTKDFDYDGMLNAGLKIKLNTPIETMKTIAADFTDVNYHREAAHLTDAIDAKEENNKKEALDHLNAFRKEIRKTLGMIKEGGSYERVDEKKGKDHDGDGDIDKDDYMAAKDKAIKKAMGKDVDETAVNEYRGVQDDVIEIIKDMAMNADGDEIEAAMELMEFIGEHYKIDFEFGRAGGGNYGRNQGAPYEGKKTDKVVRESVKAIIINALHENKLNEAYTGRLQGYIDKDYNSETQMAAKDLMEVLEAIEKNFIQLKGKVEAALEKAGPYLAPALASAFKRDLNNQRVSYEDVKLPSTPKVSETQPAELEEKDTVFAPTNETER